MRRRSYFISSYRIIKKSLTFEFRKIHISTKNFQILSKFQGQNIIKMYVGLVKNSNKFEILSLYISVCIDIYSTKLKCAQVGLFVAHFLYFHQFNEPIEHIYFL
jgi:hypothetical protein